MSVRAVEHVRNLRGVTAAEKAILYALADHHNNRDNGCWPNIDTITQEAGEMGDRTARRLVHSLVEKGVIRISTRRREDGSQTSNFYQFVGLKDENKRSDKEDTPLPIWQGRGVPVTPLEPEENHKVVKESGEEQVFYKALVDGTDTYPGVHSQNYWDRSDPDWMQQVDLNSLKHAVSWIGQVMGVTGQMQLPTPPFLPALCRLGRQLSASERYPGNFGPIVEEVPDAERTRDKILYGVAQRAGDIWTGIVQQGSWK